VVSHEATRTGAPRVAIQVVEALRAHGYEVVVVLRARGPLAPEFAAQGARLVSEPLRRTRAVLRRLRWGRRVFDRLEPVVARLVLARLRPSVVYLNSVKSACYVKPALGLGVPTILHIHELEPLASSVLRRYRLTRHFERARLVACSPKTRDNLARITGVQRDTITVLPSPVDVARIESMVAAEPSTPVVEDPSTLVVGACGLADQGKGIDLWLRMAASVRALRPELIVRFVWIGRERDDGPRALARDLGLADVVQFVGETSNPYPMMAGMAVFTLSSRHDASPLVVVEAMTLARPVVAFDVGDVTAQLAGTGVVVPSADVAGMADAVIGLLDDPEQRRRLGEEAAARARSRYGIARFRQAVTSLVDDEVERARQPLGGPRPSK